MICWAAKWTDSDEVMVGAEWMGGHKRMCQQLHKLMTEADIVVAHNGNKFDRPWINGEFLKHRLGPPAPTVWVDTYLVARKNFKITSNRLDYLGEFLEVGRKIDTGGFELWVDVMNGDAEARQNMITYNIQDVSLLERVYYELLPWIRNHPNLANYSDAEAHACPNCGGEHVHRRGFSHTNVGKYQRYQCQDCMTWSRGRSTVKDKEIGKVLLSQDKAN